MAVAEAGLMILDVTDPQVILSVGGAAMDEEPGYAYDMDLEGDYAFFVARIPSKQADFFMVFDIRNPVSPSRIGISPSTTASILTVSGGTAITSDRSNQYRVVDLTDLTKPVLSQIYYGNGAVTGLDASQADFFLASNGGGLLILNVANLSDPVRKGIFGEATSLRSVVVNGNYAYVSNIRGRVLVLDVSNPDQPQKIGDFLPKDQQVFLVLSGKNLFAVSNRRIDIYDLSHAAAPTYESSYKTTSGIWGLAASGNYIYAQLDGGTDP